MDEVKIGSQIWSLQNLQIDKFRNGDSIFQIKNKDEWQRISLAALPAYSIPENDINNISTYGLLYNWYAVNDPRGLAPEGWRIPSVDDWKTLVDYLGGYSNIETGSKMKSVTGWNPSDDGTDANGSNISGFNAFPAGLLDLAGEFHQNGDNTFWWSSTFLSGRTAYITSLTNDKTFIESGGVWVHSNIHKNFLYLEGCASVRCIR